MSDTESVTCRLQGVEIQRGKDVLTADVPEHEVDVLRAVHGVDNVRVVNEHVDDVELPINADIELARMEARYRRVNAPCPVRIAYPMGARSMESFGFALGRGVRDAAPQSGVHVHAKPAKEAKAKAK